MPTYKAIADGFINGALHGPNNPRRNVVHTDTPLNPVPAWLEPIQEETQAQRKRRMKSTEKAAEKVEEQRKEIESAVYTEDLLAQKGVETL